MEVGLSVVRSFRMRSLEVNGKKATAEFQMRDEEVAELLQQLLKKDVKLLTFHDREPTLEDVFMSVTEGLVMQFQSMVFGRIDRVIKHAYLIFAFKSFARPVDIIRHFYRLNFRK